MLRDLGITPHLPIATSKNGAFPFPPNPIFMHTGDMLTAVVKVNVGGRGHSHAKGRAAQIATYGTGSITATHDGPGQLTVHPTPTGTAALKRKGRLFVTVSLAFGASARQGSTSSTKDYRVKLHKSKKHGR
jgi:hypothetical protein